MAQGNPLFTALQQLGFETAGAVCYGRWKGYNVSFRLIQSYYQIDFAVRVDKKDASIRKNILKSAKEHGLPRGIGCVNNGHTITFTATFKRKDYAEQATLYLNACAAALRENGIAPADSCAVCGGRSPESLCFLGSYQPVHSACVRGIVDQTRETAESNLENGSYLSGFFGALLGMLVGLIPSVLTILFMNTIYGLLFALVPLAAAWGYRKFKGKQTKGSIVIIIILSLLGVLVMQYLSLSLYIMQNTLYGAADAFSYSLAYFLSAEGFVSVLEDSIVHFLFMVLGIFIAWRYISQTNESAVKNAETVLGTLRQNPDFRIDSYPVGDSTEQI